MSRSRGTVLLAIAFMAAIPFLSALPSGAQDEIRKERVRFEPGASSATVEGNIEGYETIDYLLGARSGQTLSVSMATEHTATYFNVLAPDSEGEAVHIGSVAGNQFEGRLDQDGDWEIRVYMMRSAARRAETAAYTLEMAITGAPDPEAARGGR